MKHFIAILTLLVSLAASPVFADQAVENELVLYSGRSKSLVGPIIEQFQRETGIKVTARYGNTAQLALAILEEGGRSPADVFWAQDAGGLGVLSKAGV
ncbi:MAG: extracellular solute-binding protein, partial [Candidatus Hydrogenedentes bacterium]|nr:extracellular solute-binding protein [Candidatus Hydrogenedentota bacterium]